MAVRVNVSRFWNQIDWYWLNARRATEENKKRTRTMEWNDGRKWRRNNGSSTFRANRNGNQQWIIVFWGRKRRKDGACQYQPLVKSDRITYLVRCCVYKQNKQKWTWTEGQINMSSCNVFYRSLKDEQLCQPRSSESRAIWLHSMWTGRLQI